MHLFVSSSSAFFNIFMGLSHCTSSILYFFGVQEVYFMYMSLYYGCNIQSVLYHSWKMFPTDIYVIFIACYGVQEIFEYR